jgi:SAM-dependent methyltransferase
MLTEQFTRHFQRVVGVDVSTKHLAEARKRLGAAVEFHEALIEELSLNEKFDTITMLCILEHVIDPVVTLRHAAKFLKPDGVLIAQVPNANAINRKLSLEMGTIESLDELSPWDIEVGGHRRYYTMESFRSDIKRAGLKVRNAGGIFYKTLSTPQMDWFLENGPWEEGGLGWGRVGGPKKDWRAEFCRASYELGKQHPEDCNVIFACATLNDAWSETTSPFRPRRFSSI